MEMPGLDFLKRGDGNETQRRMSQLRESIEFLQEYEPRLLEGLEKARRDQVPFTVEVVGYEHSGDVVIAVLRSAHAFGVHITIVPHPISHISDKSA